MDMAGQIIDHAGPDSLHLRRPVRCQNVPERCHNRAVEHIKNIGFDAQTLVVNRHGAKIYADFPLLAGAPITITVAGKSQPLQGVIAWASKDMPGIFGLEVTSGEASWE